MQYGAVVVVVVTIEFFGEGEYCEHTKQLP